MIRTESVDRRNCTVQRIPRSAVGAPLVDRVRTGGFSLQSPLFDPLAVFAMLRKYIRFGTFCLLPWVGLSTAGAQSPPVLLPQGVTLAEPPAIERPDGPDAISSPAPPAASLETDSLASTARPEPAAGSSAAATITLRPAAGGEDRAQPAMAPRDVRFGSNVPSLRVHTQGPDTLVVGKQAQYLITLANQSDFLARDIAVYITLPAWVELQGHQAESGVIQRRAGTENSDEQLSWKVDQVAARGQQTLTLLLVPRAGRAFELGVDVSVSPTASATKIAVKEPKLKLHMTGTADVVSGEEARWSIAVENPGTGDAHDVTLDLFTDTQKLGTQSIGIVEAGSRRMIDVTLKTTQAGRQLLQAVAVAEPGLSAKASTPYVVRRGELNVRMQGPAFEYAGTQATYEIRISNSGNATAKDVRVDFALPNGATYVGGLEGADVKASGLRWKIDHIEAGMQNAFRITCQLNQAGEHLAKGTATSADGLTAADAVTTAVHAAADLQLQVMDPPGPRAVGAPVELEIRLTNRGSATANQVYIAAFLAPGVELVDVTGNASIEAGEIFFQAIPQLAPGKTVSQKITVRAAEEGSHPFRVVVECDEPDSRLVCEESTRFFLRDSVPQVASPLPLRKIDIR